MNQSFTKGTLNIMTTPNSPIQGKVSPPCISRKTLPPPPLDLSKSSNFTTKNSSDHATTRPMEEPLEPKIIESLISLTQMTASIQTRAGRINTQSKNLINKIKQATPVSKKGQA
jgi:hypothetical protein